MKEQDLRALVREAVARHLGDRGGLQSDPVEPPMLPLPSHAPVAPGHASHAVYIHLVNVDDACVIEPGVACNHCNYCRSHGH